MLGGVPIHAPAQMEALSRVQPSDPRAALEAAAMVREALAGEEAVIAFMHEGIEAAGAAGDPGTADLLTRFVQEHQKQAWFLRAMAA
jgi:starvation-inducible DNA-binding protein